MLVENYVGFFRCSYDPPIGATMSNPAIPILRSEFASNG